MTVSEKTRMPHGYSRYARGCRCEVCVGAQRAMWLAYSRKRRVKAGAS